MSTSDAEVLRVASEGNCVPVAETELTSYALTSALAHGRAQADAMTHGELLASYVAKILRDEVVEVGFELC